MNIRQIQCCACSNTGYIEVHGLMEMLPESMIFRHLGHTGATGHLYFLCPYCGDVLQVDPIETQSNRMIKGFPGNHTLNKYYDYTRRPIKKESRHCN